MSFLRAICMTALAALALGLVACGGESDEDQVKDVVTQVAESDEAVCDKTTAKFLKALGGTRERCRKEARKDSGARKAKVGKVEVDGDKATAELSADGSTARFGLVKDGDEWKLDTVR